MGPSNQQQTVGSLFFPGLGVWGGGSPSTSMPRPCSCRVPVLTDLLSGGTAPFPGSAVTPGDQCLSEPRPPTPQPRPRAAPGLLSRMSRRPQLVPHLSALPGYVEWGALPHSSASAAARLTATTGPVTRRLAAGQWEPRLPRRPRTHSPALWGSRTQAAPCSRALRAPAGAALGVLPCGPGSSGGTEAAGGERRQAQG